MAADHLSLYQLTIEPETPFFRLHAGRKARACPMPELAAEFYALTQEITEAHGLPAYEISNHAAPGGGSRAQPHLLALPGLCRRRARRAWPHHRRRRQARDDEREASGALAGEGRGRAATALVTDEALTLEEAADEMLLMGLRLREGVPSRALSRR